MFYLPDTILTVFLCVAASRSKICMGLVDITSSPKDDSKSFISYCFSNEHVTKV